jgi:hypothetical protein
VANVDLVAGRGGDRLGAVQPVERGLGSVADTTSGGSSSGLSDVSPISSSIFWLVIDGVGST